MQLAGIVIADRTAIVQQITQIFNVGAQKRVSNHSIQKETYACYRVQKSSFQNCISVYRTSQSATIIMGAGTSSLDHRKGEKCCLND